MGGVVAEQVSEKELRRRERAERKRKRQEARDQAANDRYQVRWQNKKIRRAAVANIILQESYVLRQEGLDSQDETTLKIAEAFAGLGMRFGGVR